MNEDPLRKERLYLANLLEAIQRSAWFLSQSERKIAWPLTAPYLAEHKKNVALFETIAAINERFAKLQDTLGAAMRHTASLMSEPNDSFLKTLSFFEKHGVLESMDAWQRARAFRNVAAHDYDTDYVEIAEHFNALHELSSVLYGTARRMLALCDESLGIRPISGDFSQEFAELSFMHSRTDS